MSWFTIECHSDNYRDIPAPRIACHCNIAYKYEGIINVPIEKQVDITNFT